MRLKTVGMVIFLGIMSFSRLTFGQNSFPDVYPSDPIDSSLRYLIDKKVIEGYDDGTFRPQTLINRAEFTKMMVEGVAGVTPERKNYSRCFKDVKIEWFARYVCYAKADGWIEGYPDGTFKPADPITRAEAVKILGSAFKWLTLSAPPTSPSRFWDNQDQEAWYWLPLALAEERGLFDHLDFYLSPHELITRKQMAELLYRAMRYEEEKPVTPQSIENPERSYQELLVTGIKPAYPADLKFPSHSQKGWPYGCYSFATKNILEFKYEMALDIPEVKDRIGWSGEFIWRSEQFETFAQLYNVDVIFTYAGSAEFFFEKLALGEPLIIYIPSYLNGENIGHQLVAYSFDDQGVWVADSLGGGYRHRIDHDVVFSESPNYNINITQLRRVKSEGQRKDQSGL